MTYEKFLTDKRIHIPKTGIDFEPILNSALFPFQDALVKWALKRGRACLFCDCGMGKTIMQLEWARVVAASQGPVIILAPLAVAHQTVEEGKRFGIDVYYEREMPEVIRGITITNYEMLSKFDLSKFTGIVLDESSILKAYDGKTRNNIITECAKLPFKLACTATPAPNDFMELGNHSEFLGVMTREEMLSMFFVHDGGETQKWRLKGHAQSEFWKWISSWAVNIRKPSNIGFDDTGYDLPELIFHQHIVNVENTNQFTLFAMSARTLQERIGARRDSVADRIAKAVEIVKADPKGQWLIWCNLNTESDGIKVVRMIWPSQNKFAKKMGLTQAYLSQIVNQDSPISPKLLKLLGYKKIKNNCYVRDVSYSVDVILPHYYNNKGTQ